MGIATMEGMEIARGSRRAFPLLMQDSPPLHQRWRGGEGLGLCEYSPFTLVYDHARATAFHMPHITLQGIINGDAGAAPCLAVVSGETSRLLANAAWNITPPPLFYTIPPSTTTCVRPVT